MIRLNRTTGLLTVAFTVFFTFFFMRSIRDGWFGYDHWENYNRAADSSSPLVRANEYFHTLKPEDYETIKQRRANFTLLEPGKANACILVVVDEDDLFRWRPTMRQLEDRFNKNYNYPYVFLSSLPFSPRFKLLVASLTTSKIEFGRIPHKQWKIPEHVDLDKARQVRAESVEKNIPDGGSLPYRFRSRYMAGFFFQHELTKKYDYYWKLDYDSELSCDMFEHDMDPFVVLHNTKKLLGFTISVQERADTIPTLWDTAKSYLPNDYKPSTLSSPEAKKDRSTSLEWISSDQGENYNYCHIWPAMEIGDFDFYRNERYMKYFDHLDKSGGFFYERWGDGAIKTMYIGLYKSLKEIEFFNYIGFYKHPYRHCPTDKTLNKRCFCNPDNNIDYESGSCNKDFFKLTGLSL